MKSAALRHSGAANGDVEWASVPDLEQLRQRVSV
jgi:hypothetical protein